MPSLSYTAKVLLRKMLHVDAKPGVLTTIQNEVNHHHIKTPTTKLKLNMNTHQPALNTLHNGLILCNMTLDNNTVHRMNICRPI